MPSLRAVLRNVLPSWLLLQCAGATAAEYCVGSSSDLNTALAVAASPTGQTTVIKLQQGTYHLGGSVLGDVDNHFNAMQLLGGYNADCSVRTLDPANTLLDADDNGEIALNPAGDLVIEGITWQDSLPFFFTMYTLAQHINVRLSNNAFIRGTVEFDTELNFAGSVTGDTLRIINNLFTGVPDKFGNGAVDFEGGFDAVLTGNTIAGNGNRGLFTYLDGSITLADNIFWDNGGSDLELTNRHRDPISATFQDNTYSTLSGSEDASSFGTLHTDPLFVDAAGGNYRVQNASPSVNSGIATSDTPSMDLDGNARVIGSTVDRGAYESSVDDTLPQVLTVTSANDSGPGTLRDAIGKTNGLTDFNYIEFNIPGSCPVTINITSADLPALTSGAKIDGFTQPGSAPNTASIGDNATRCIILDADGVATNGLVFSGASTSHVWVQGLAFSGYPGAALELAGGTNDIVLGNQFGGKVGGVTLAANDTDIKLTQFARNALIGFDTPAFRNVIAGATNYGISIGALGSSSTGHIIAGNLFGIYGSNAFFGSDGNRSALNITTGNNMLTNNVFADNFHAVDISGANAQGNTIQNNAIGRIPQVCFVLLGVQHCLPDAAPNVSGIAIESGAHDNVVQSNTIWNNAANGIVVADAGQGNLLSGNSIFNNGCCAEGDTFGGIYLFGTAEGDYDGTAGASSLPNRGQNAPAIARAYGGSDHGWMEGSLGSTKGAYAIEAFASQPRSGSYGDGSIYIGAGSATITHAPVGANGYANLSVVLSSPGSPLTTGLKITATATDSLNNTSQFSSPVDYLCDVIFANGVDDAETNACQAP